MSYLKRDVLPEGYADPMLMSHEEINMGAESFAREGNERGECFLLGVQFAMNSLLAAGVMLGAVLSETKEKSQEVYRPASLYHLKASNQFSMNPSAARSLM